jgi:hypothetical protein
MATLDSSFTREELETLIEAMGDWEMLGNQEWSFAQLLKSAPMPPTDHEAFDVMHQIKEHFKNREKEINASRAMRQETAVFLKAKLMLARRDCDINKLFDFASSSIDVEKTPSKKPFIVVPSLEENTPPSTSDQKLTLAEHFIYDLGSETWSLYEMFVNKNN